jgi:malic enzyme
VKENELSADYIVPTVFNPNVVTAVAEAVEKVAASVADKLSQSFTGTAWWLAAESAFFRTNYTPNVRQIS